MNEDEEILNFHEMGLDDRILEAIARLKWKEPTPIQEKAIPLFLQGRDIFARSRTGSGKTGAFLIPLIHKILEGKTNLTRPVTSALIIAPSKELCKQITEHIQQLTALCKREVKFIDLSLQVPVEAQKTLLADNPDIVVGTPLKITNHISEGSLKLAKSLQYMIIDEADLMFAYEHEKELSTVLKHLPTICQSFITSATLPQDVKQLKNRVLHNPVILRLEEPPLPSEAQLTQYVVKVEDFDKATLLYALLRLNLIRGKTLIFVNAIDKGYKIRMFLGLFGIQSCILNSELPVASRCHIMDEFNSGKYNILIASDEKAVKNPSFTKGGTRKRKRKFDSESGVSRGIDFHSVSVVVNFDFPPDATSYVHRVGRTARASMQGTALSFVSEREMNSLKAVEEELKKLIPGSDCPFKDYKFNMSSLAGFRYRATDAWKQCTNIAVRDYRKKELRAEILNSQKLKAFFEKHPKDLEILRHDVQGKPVRGQPHLRNVPDYNIPPSLKRSVVIQKKTTQNSGSQRAQWQSKQRKRHSMRQKKDPLRSLKFTGLKK